MSAITERARAAIEANDYQTPDACLKYLIEPQNFNSLSEELTRLMPNLGYGNTLDEQNAALLNQIDQLGLENANQVATLKNNARPWLSGERVIISRKYAIMLCFALKLDKQQSRDFLRKGCHEASFNFRNAKELVFSYCLNNKKTYSEALALFKQYLEIPQIDSAETNPISATRTLRDFFADTDFTDDDNAFIKALCDNRQNFICYNNSIVRHYRLLRISLSKKIIEKYLDDFEPLFRTSHNEPERYQDENGRWVAMSYEISVVCPECGENSYIVDDPICNWACVFCQREIKNPDPVPTKITGVLLKLSEDDPDFKPLYDNFVSKHGFKKRNVWALTLKKIRNKKINEYELLKDIISDYLLFKEILGGVPFRRNNGYGRPEAQAYRDSILKNDLFIEAPRRQTLSALDNPTSAVPNRKNHKLLVLLFFTNYLFGWLTAINPCCMGYEDFHAKLSSLLDECGLPSLYAGDPYDWFILKTIRSVENNKPDEGDPIGFFNEVIQRSFAPME